MKKIIFILIFSLFTTCITYMQAQAFNFTVNSPVDIDEHWSEEYIETLSNLGVMNGFKGYTNPDSIITRGEFTALITRAFEFKSGQNAKEFVDIPKEHIFYSEIQAASNEGIIDGFSDNTFRPDNMITREEIILILSRISPGKASEKAIFNDIKNDYTYIHQLSKVVEDKIISGYPDKTFKPYNKTTRAEAAKMIINAMKKYINNDDADKIYGFTKNYILWHFSNTESASVNSCGSAYKDIEYIKNTYKIAEQYGYNIVNTPTDISITMHKNYGPFSELIITYNVTTKINNNTKKI